MIIENINWSDKDIFYQMALDESLLLQAIDQRNENVIIRFFSPSNQSITIGRSQSVADFNQEISAKYNVEMVRRITGGRAVPHYQELTYSLIAPVKGLAGGTIPESYFKISNCLAQGLKQAGFPVEITRHQSGDKSSLSCFAARGKSEITFQGKKILGSAQYRKQDYLLQQGTLIYQTLPAYFDYIIPQISGHSLIDLYHSYLKSGESELADIIEPVNPIPSRFMIMDNILPSFEKIFCTEMIKRNPTNREHQTAVKLRESKYKSTVWNENKKQAKLTIKR